MKDALNKLLTRHAISEGTTMQSALRDLLTDLHHLADEQDLDFDLAVDGADAVYEEEKGA